MVEELDKRQDNLNKANEKSIKLDNNFNEVKGIVENLKNSFGSKDKYILTKEGKDKILNYIDNVNDTNKDYKNTKRTKLLYSDKNYSYIIILQKNKNDMYIISSYLIDEPGYLNKIIKEYEKYKKTS